MQAESTTAKDKRLDALIANNDIKQSIINTLTMATAPNSGNVGRSIMLYGPNGIGKSTLCYQLAALILSNFGELKVEPNQLLHLTHPDFFVLDNDDSEGKNIGVDAIRKMINFARYHPVNSDYKVVIVDKVDDLNKSSANALLKILEEPPKNTFVFLVADSLGKALPTIRSRCLKFKLNSFDLKQFSEVVGNDIGSLKLYNMSQGSATVARQIAHEELGDLAEIVERALFERKASMQEINGLADAVSNSHFAWNMFKDTVLYKIFARIKSSAHTDSPDRLQRQLQYMAEIKDNFAKTDVFNLDKRAQVYSILC